MLSHFKSDQLICGIDEAGRGCLAGPVVAAAVILPKTFSNNMLNDSKQLREIQRNELRVIIEREAITFGIGIIDNRCIDEVNILQATYLAMHAAVSQLKMRPELLLIDGNRFRPYSNIRHQCIIKGDAEYLEIAAASVLAKTYRDAIMQELHQEYPNYIWQKNKGYPTTAHRQAIQEFGACPYHRTTFRLLKEGLPALL